MHLDEEAINVFKELYLQEYGIQLTDQEVLEYGIRLIRFVQTVYGSDLPKNVLDREGGKYDN